MNLLPRIASILVLMFLSISARAQCAMCRAVLESEASDGGALVSRGINDGIVFLMVFPYVLMALAALFIFRDQIRGFFSK